MSKAVFLDRDGVINRERGDYTYKVEDFEIIDGVIEALDLLKQDGFKLIVITNQGGISKKLFDQRDMKNCFDYLQSVSGGMIDAHYFSPYHPTITRSLLSKPDTLMIEKAIAKFDLDISQCWLVGDHERDILAGNKLLINTILVESLRTEGNIPAKYFAHNLLDAVKRFIIS